MENQAIGMRFFYLFFFSFFEQNGKKKMTKNGANEFLSLIFQFFYFLGKTER